MDENKRNFWKEEEENLLRQWADKAQCYQWLHSRCNNIYSKQNALFTIPVIIISTITGTANFAQDRFNEEIRNYVVITIGTLSIIAGIITTISQFLKIAEINEGHRVAALSWGKFYRNIKTELTRHPLDRIPPLELIKFSKNEYDRLVELSPFVLIKVVQEFNSKFKKNVDLAKPEICDELVKTLVYELDEDERSKLAMISMNVTEPKENENVLRKRKIIKKQTDQKVEKFKQTFFNINQRYPNQKEISNHLNKYLDDIPVTEESIEMESFGGEPVSFEQNGITDNIRINIGPPVEESETDNIYPGKQENLFNGDPELLGSRETVYDDDGK